MIKKIILAVTLALIFVVSFAAGVGFIIAGVGDFSWDIVSQYVSLSELTMINDTPISNLFSFSDHSELVGSHAEGKVGCPTENGTITISNIANEATIVASPDEYIHLTFDGKIRASSLTKNPKNLTGQNIPDIQFEFNASTDDATIKIRKLRGKEVKMEIAIPASFAGNIVIKDVGGSVVCKTTMNLKSFEARDIGGTLTAEGVSAETLKLSDTAGTTSFTGGSFNKLTVDDCAGKIQVSGSIGSFDIKSVMGTAKLESSTAINADCTIKSIMGSLTVKLPSDCKFKLEKSGVVGLVTPKKGDSKAAFTITVKDVMGKVSIDR